MVVIIINDVKWISFVCYRRNVLNYYMIFILFTDIIILFAKFLITIMLCDANFIQQPNTYIEKLGEYQNYYNKTNWTIHYGIKGFFLWTFECSIKEVFVWL